MEIDGPGVVATELLGEPHWGRLVLLPEESDPRLALDVALAGAVVVLPGRAADSPRPRAGDGNPRRGGRIARRARPARPRRIGGPPAGRPAPPGTLRGARAGRVPSVSYTH